MAWRLCEDGVMCFVEEDGLGVESRDGDGDENGHGHGHGFEEYAASKVSTTPGIDTTLKSNGTAAAYLKVAPASNGIAAVGTPTLTDWGATFEEQLKAYATQNRSIQDRPIQDKQSTESGSESEWDYESDRTDFLERGSNTPTPCPQDFGHADIRAIAEKRPRKKPRSVSVSRRLFSGYSAIENSAASQSAAATSLEQLRKIEYPPAHRWSDPERELLCVMNRFYQRQNHDFAQVFNNLTGLNISTNRITRQYDDYIKLHGPAAFPMYRETQACPLTDPDGKYSAIRQSIEAAADDLGIILEPQGSATPSPSSSSKASTAKSVRTRQRFRALVQQAKFRKTPSMSPPIVQKPFDKRKLAQVRLGGVAVALDEQWEELVDIKNISEADRIERIISPANIDSSIAFRVWDEDSWTIYDTKRGFVANGHTSWNGSLLPPLSPTTDKNALLFLTYSHMSKVGGGASGFVSVSRSLLQVINYAAEKKDPWIAVIDLAHPTLNEENKRLEASVILRWLKKHGQAEWVRYKGTTEALFWAHIPKEAIIHITRFSNLTELLRNVSSCANLLNLDLFEPGGKVRTLANELGRRNVVLDRQTTADMAKISRVLGLHSAGARLDHISDFVARLVDGWSIRYQYTDTDDLDGFAATFAIGLRSEAHDLQGVSAAFVEGVRKGMASLEFYSRKNRKRKRCS